MKCTLFWNAIETKALSGIEPVIIPVDPGLVSLIRASALTKAVGNEIAGAPGKI